ncbi:hypothetical protein [Enorma sp.]|uniref:hypothetical protein n=1 Tax=Enorma sp. TaxID=1920692 RepID=UPI0025BDE767|nr:hypothetical protein [Enorma sp.]
MMPTDDERRRVARNIRENYVRGGLGYKIASSYNIAMAVGIVPELIVGDIELWNRLADLIEPPLQCPHYHSDRHYCSVHEDVAVIDRDALLALADVLSTPEQDVDCKRCPLRRWCEEARETGRTITCYDCKTWHTADAIREALGETAL